MSSSIEKFLSKLGLEKEAVKVLNLLITCGDLSVQEIFRKTKFSEIKVYRVLKLLEKLGLVMVNTSHRPIKYSPPQINILEDAVEQKRKEVEQLGLYFIDSFNVIEKCYKSRATDIKVNYFSGKEEARELLWNSLQAKDYIKSFGYRSMREALGVEFLIRWFNEAVLRGIKQYLLANPSTFKLKAQHGPRGKEDFVENPKNLYFRRYFEEKELKIINETFIYNDIYAVLHWDDKNIFGIEVHHPEIARQQELVFDFLWKKAKIYKGN